MEPLDYWRLCDELSVDQAALLIIGEDPSEFQTQNAFTGRNRPGGLDAVRTALVSAIERKRLPANIIEYEDNSGRPGRIINWNETTIPVENLRAWLRSRGIETGFFLPEPPAGADYLSRVHSNYSPKLAAAIEAWKAVSADDELRHGKSVKQALIVWLRQHANEFGLTKEDGNPNEQGIEDVAKIANWDLKGGAPKTPGNE
jgi:hypothetical protein